MADTETQTRLETVKTRLRRGRHAYIGLYGLAYDRFQMRREQAAKLTNDLFENLKEQGEVTLKHSEVLIKKTQSGALQGYADVSEKAVSLMPAFGKSKVERLEDELAELKAKYDRMNKAAKAEKKSKPAAKKKTVTKKKVKVEEKAVEVVAKAEPVIEAKPVIEAPKAIIEKPVVETPVVTEAKETKVEAEKTPRHIPYFLEVKRYDPLASEDVVRKIVNHCGIALRSEDAKYVACSDESERVTVRESWLRKKLGLTLSDQELDKKVLDVCSLMQRDQKKNRVTFYYLLAKKERLLDTL